MVSLFQRLKDTFRGSSSESAPAATSDGPAVTDIAEPVNLQHVWTAEPDALKLQVSRLLMPLGERRSYSDRDTARESPLAQVLLNLDGISKVELDATSVQVNMDAEADWNQLMERVPEVVKQHLESGGIAVEGLTATPKKRRSFGFREISPDSRPAEEQREIVQKLFAEEINPAVGAHGGYFTLLGVEQNNVYVQLGGGCQGCGMADVTLRQGVEQRLREVLPEMHELIDSTDHRAGTNPYYTPGK